VKHDFQPRYSEACLQRPFACQVVASFSLGNRCFRKSPLAFGAAGLAIGQALQASFRISRLEVMLDNESICSYL
ncbi:hypothetical protein ACC687_41990, partial [Rhizobium ruizarguesonis]